MTKHAFLSASGAPAWTRCEIKPWREKGLPEERSVYAQEGTEAHLRLSECIRLRQPANKDDIFIAQTVSLIEAIAKEVGISKDNILSEQELDISFITGEQDARGTADVVLVGEQELIVVDLKYGMGVTVNAVDNEQLLIYGAAALEEYDLLGEIETLRMVISQPRLAHTSEWVLSAAEVRLKADELRIKAQRILAAKGGVDLHATPGNPQCQFCKAKGDCPEYRGFVLSTVTDDFVNLDERNNTLHKIAISAQRLPLSDDHHLATCLEAVDMIEQWCSAVRNEVYQRLNSGKFSDARFKLVQGKRGYRKWRDEKRARAVAKNWQILDKVVETVLLSPTQIEKKFKGTPFWEDVQKYIMQAEGKPTVVAAEDSRPALDRALTFEPISDETEYVESLAGLTKNDD